jgi:hypothetical protein
MASHNLDHVFVCLGGGLWYDGSYDKNWSQMSLQSVDPNIRHHIIMSYLVATPPFVNPVKCFMFGELVTKPVVQNRVVPWARA